MSQAEVVVQEAPCRRVDEGPWSPTPSMLRFAEVCYQKGLEATDASRCEDARIKLKTLEIWRKRPEFRDWLRAEMERRLADDTWLVWLRLQEQAWSGNLQSMKLYLERFDTADRRQGNAMPDTFHELAELASLAAENCTEAMS